MSTTVLRIFKDSYECGEDDNMIKRLKSYASDLIVTVEGVQDATGFVLKDKWVMCAQTFGSLKNELQIITRNGIVIEGSPVFDMREINLALIETLVPCSTNQTLIRNEGITPLDLNFRFEAVKGKDPKVILMEEVTGKEKAKLLKRDEIFQTPQYVCGCPVFSENAVLQYVTVFTLDEYIFCIPAFSLMRGFRGLLEHGDDHE